MINNLTKISIKILLLNLVFLSPSYGYFDPGSGYLILQSLFALIAYITLSLNVVKTFFRNLYCKIFRIKEKTPAEDKNSTDKDANTN